MKPYGLIFLLFLAACNSSRNPLWKWDLQGRCYADPVTNDDTVFIASSAGEIIAGSSRTGKKQWEKKAGGPIVAAPAVSGNILFLATQNGFVRALDKRTGREIWSNSFSADGFEAPLTVTEEILLVPSRAGRLYGLSSNDGRILWQHAGNSKYNVRAVVSDNSVLIGGWANLFFCFTKEGTIRWQFKAAEPIVEEAVVNDNVVYFATLDNFLYALELPSGRFLWKVNARFPKNPAIVNDELIFASANQLIVLRPQDGKPLRKFTLEKPVSHFYGPERCMILSGDVYRLDFSSGKRSILLDSPNPIFKVAFTPQAMIAVDELYSVFASAM